MTELTQKNLPMKRMKGILESKLVLCPLEHSSAAYLIFKHFVKCENILQVVIIM